MFRTHLAQFTYLYDISIESYTRCAKSHHSSPVYAHCQCCAKSSTLTPLTDHASVCAPPKDQVTINTTQVDRRQIGHLNETCTRGQTTQTMHICAHLDEQTGGLGGHPEDAHVLHDTPKHLRGAQVMVSCTYNYHDDMLVFVWPIIC